MGERDDLLTYLLLLAILAALIALHGLTVWLKHGTSSVVMSAGDVCTNASCPCSGSGPVFTQNSASGNPVVLTKPSGTVSGDGLLGCCACAGSSSGATFTQTGTFSAIGTPAAVNNNIGVGFLGRVAGGSEPTSYSLTTDPPGFEALVQIPSPVGAIGTWAKKASSSGTSGTTWNPTSFSMSAGDWTFAIIAWKSSSVITVSTSGTGWNQLTSGSQVYGTVGGKNLVAQVWYYEATGSITFNPGTFTFSSAPSDWAGSIAYVPG